MWFLKHFIFICGVCFVCFMESFYIEANKRLLTISHPFNYTDVSLKMSTNWWKRSGKNHRRWFNGSPLGGGGDLNELAWFTEITPHRQTIEISAAFENGRTHSKEGIKACPNPKFTMIFIQSFTSCLMRYLNLINFWRQHRCILHCLWYPTILCITFCDGWAKKIKMASEKKSVL